MMPYNGRHPKALALIRAGLMEPKPAEVPQPETPPVGEGVETGEAPRPRGRRADG